MDSSASRRRSGNRCRPTYRVSPDAETPLINISTRGYVGTGADLMIAGFVVQGESPVTVVVTGKGPSLSDYGVRNLLENPTLTLVRQSDQVVIATNDDWQQSPDAAQIAAAGFAPSSRFESARPRPRCRRRLYRAAVGERTAARASGSSRCYRVSP
jgi:hypothetical protein